MDSGFYVAYAGLASRMEALDVVAGNLANASTAGFKAQIPFYRELTAAQGGEVLTSLNQAVNEFGILAAVLPPLLCRGALKKRRRFSESQARVPRR